MKSNFFFANSAVSSIFLTPVSKLISLREELVNKLDMIDVVCVLSSRDPEADSRLYDTLLLTRDLVGYIEQEINRRYLERTGSVPEDDDYKFFRENMDDILYEESILRNLDSAPLEIAMQMPPLGVCVCVKVTVENEPAYAEPKRENLKNQKPERKRPGRTFRLRQFAIVQTQQRPRSGRGYGTPMVECRSGADNRRSQPPRHSADVRRD